MGKSCNFRFIYLRNQAGNSLQLLFLASEVVQLFPEITVKQFKEIWPRDFFLSPGGSFNSCLFKYSIQTDHPTIFLEHLPGLTEGTTNWLLHTEPQRLVNFEHIFRHCLPGVVIDWTGDPKVEDSPLGACESNIPETVVEVESVESAVFHLQAAEETQAAEKAFPEPSVELESAEGAKQLLSEIKQPSPSNF
uniref:Uncharacterized protein n=1 Tax=Beihai sipunculid worm virus 7 TaxID=1922679 RepID=A0A1L3KPD1_9VIRU|nr:hypothetical protein [Beihai sipunculid worm virus 7]